MIAKLLPVTAFWLYFFIGVTNLGKKKTADFTNVMEN
jgi:hypothetical protein